MMQLITDAIFSYNVIYSEQKSYELQNVLIKHKQIFTVGIGYSIHVDTDYLLSKHYQVTQIIKC